MNSHDYLRSCRVEIWPQHFAVIKVKYVPENVVAVFRDREEITVVADEQHLHADWIIEVERGWRMLSFRVTLPFELVGFLAAVSQELANAQISIFAISAYSTDHLLIKEHDLPRAIHCLESLGCTINQLP